MAHAMAANDVRLLPALAQRMRAVQDQGPDISTAAFASLIDEVVRVFDYLGTVLSFAKHDMASKNDSLKAAAVQLPLLQTLVEADVRRGTATVKDSCARNLHRLLCAVKFMRVLLDRIASSPSVSVKEAATAAYQEALAPIHSYVIRTAVWAGMYVLPTREVFMQQLGETEASALPAVVAFLDSSKVVEPHLQALFHGVTMPASVPTANILAGIWAWSSGTSPANATTVAAAAP